MFTPQHAPDKLSSDEQRIQERCAEAYQHYDQKDHKAALREFYQVWITLPKPQHEHRAAGWVLTGIGDCYFQLQQYAQAIEALRSALCCPEGDLSPFTHLRLGQSLLQGGDQGQARKSLLKAYQQGGQKLFMSENTLYLKAIEDLTPQ